MSTNLVTLRDAELQDIPALFEFQNDPAFSAMAYVKPRSREAFDQHFRKTLKDPNCIINTILLGDTVAGVVVCFQHEKTDSLGYSVGREFWGQGIATAAVKLFLEDVSIRPLTARVARTNLASIRVMEKCGFAFVKHELSPETERYLACEEAVYVLEK